MKPNFANNINKKIGVNGTFIAIYNNIDGSTKKTIVDFISPLTMNRVMYREENKKFVPCEFVSVSFDKYYMNRGTELTPNFKHLFEQIEGKIDSQFNFFLDIGCLPTRF